jgi:hypothetical protein
MLLKKLATTNSNFFVDMVIWTSCTADNFFFFFLLKRDCLSLVKIKKQGLKHSTFRATH